MNPDLTRQWAEWQSTVFETGKCPIADFLKWSAVCELQEKECPTNLTLRQNAIGIAVADIFGDNPYRQIFINQFDALHRNGYAIEGESYWDFIQPAITFVKERIGRDIVDPAIVEAIEENYRALAFPDGSLPLPETSADVRLPFDPLTMADDVDTPSYRVKRWFNATHTECLAQLLVCKDAEAEPRANLHYHLAAGYYVLWLKGTGYVNRVKPYSGFDLVRGIASMDLSKCLPDNALLTFWRKDPPTIGVDLEANRATFLWTHRQPDGSQLVTAERQITWDSASVTVTDNGVERKWEIPQ